MKLWDIWKQNTDKPIFIKFVMHMFLIVLIPSLILSVVYISLNEKIKVQTYERCEEALENSAKKLEMQLDSLDNITMYYADNMDIVNLLNMKPSDISENATVITRAQNHLPSMKLGNSNILNIQIYAGRSGILIDAATAVIHLNRYYGGQFVLEGVTEDEFLGEHLKEKRVTAYRQNTMTLKGSTYGCLIYNNMITGVNIENKSNRIIFYLRDSALFEDSDKDHKDTAFYCVADSNEEVIYCDNPAIDVASVIPFSKVAEDRGYFIKRINGQKTFLTYYRSQGRDLICIEALPVSEILSITNGFRIATMSLFLLATILAVMIMILSARRLSKPIEEARDLLGKNVPLEDFVREIGQLVSNNEALTEKMKQQVSIMRTEAFYRLFTGECADDETFEEQLKIIGIRQDAALYAVLLLNCNDMGVDTGVEEVGAQKVFLEELIRDQNIPEIQEIYQIDFERMIILFASEDDSISKMRDLANKLAEKLISELSEKGGYSVSVSGDIFTDILKLQRVFIHVQKALNLPLNVCGAGRVQWYDKVKRYKEIEQYKEVEQTDSGRARGENVSIQNQVLVDKVTDYIKAHYNNPQLSLSMAGEEFYITEVYLSKLFKRATGDNFSKYLEKIRVEKAKKLLKAGEKVSDVATQVGYNSPQVFRRAYKRYYGCIPSEDCEQAEESESSERKDIVSE